MLSLPPHQRVLPALALHGGRARPDLPSAYPGTGDRGIEITKSFIAGRDGLYWQGTSFHDQVIPVVTPVDGFTEIVLYAPTGKPYGNGCLEAVGVHGRTMLPSAGVTNHASGFWNHCASPPGWIQSATEYMSNALWRQKYLFFDSQYNSYNYGPRVRPTSVNCQVGELWNFQAGVWDIKTPVICGTIPGVPSTDPGWLMWETYGLMNATQGTCPTIAPISAWNSHIYDGSPYWTILYQQYANSDWPFYGKCWTQGTYTLSWWSPNTTYDWKARTPTG